MDAMTVMSSPPAREVTARITMIADRGGQREGIGMEGMGMVAVVEGGMGMRRGDRRAEGAGTMGGRGVMGVGGAGGREVV